MPSPPHIKTQVSRHFALRRQHNRVPEPQHARTHRQLPLRSRQLPAPSSTPNVSARAGTPGCSSPHASDPRHSLPSAARIRQSLPMSYLLGAGEQQRPLELTALAPCLATSISSRWATRKLFPVPALPVMKTFSPLSTTACIMAFCSAERFAVTTWLMQSEFASHSPRARDHELQRDASVRRRQCHAAPRRKLGVSTAVASLPPGAHAHASAATILSNAAAPLSQTLIANLACSRLSALAGTTAANSHRYACIAIRYILYICISTRYSIVI